MDDDARATTRHDFLRRSANRSSVTAVQAEELDTCVSPDVQRILSRAPRPFADWAARNVAAFR